MNAVARTAPLLTGLVAALCWLAGCDRSEQPDASRTAMPADAPPVAAFVGGTACAECHEDAAASWANSHHDLAMQEATEATVLGDFGDTDFAHNGLTSRFFRRDEGFWVRTDDEHGELVEFRISHTFGVEPLQQYLIPRVGGRYQVLTIAWDTRSADRGGQRWFSVYGADEIASDDPLHWTGVFQNWNTSCAACHSTRLRKNYAPETDSFDTAWSSIDVDCEACHGPGSLHAEEPDEWPMRLGGGAEAQWVFEPGATIAERRPARRLREEIETCAQCHSRRGQLTDDVEPGAPLLAGFRPALLDDGLYHADGQILDEVYVYGSFVQSRMYAAGVTCSDCHDPHTATLKADGSAVCAQCHLASAYDVGEHHRHEAGQPGSACVDCHMPARTYMVVDPRRDHGFRVPRPDLSDELDAPNACTGCHAERSNEWAASVLASWYPEGRGGEPHYGQALAAGRRWDRDRKDRLLALARDPTAPAIARATAVGMLGPRLDSAALASVEAALDSGDTQLQLSALNALDGQPASLRLRLARPFVSHRLLALRLAAARQLAGLRMDLPQAERVDLDRALEEYRESQAFNADRAEAYLNLAALATELGDPAGAEDALRQAIERQDYLAAPYVNLADLYRRSGRDAEALALLQTAVDEAPEDPAGHLALGLAEVRSGSADAGLERFRHAVELAPNEPYYRYVLGVALNAVDGAAAIATLKEANGRFPGYRDITFALATMHRDAGDTETARRYARELLALSPRDPIAIGLLAELETERQ